MRVQVTESGRDLTLLGLALLMIYLLTANHGPLGSSTRYYEAAREMVELGDWVVPHLAYVPYVEKPPLVYWLGASARLLGDHPLLINLPSLLATLVMISATYLFGREWRNRQVGLTAAGLLLGATMTQVFSGVLLTDPLLAAALSVGWLLWWRWDQQGRTRLAPLLGFYVVVAIGWLAKGPVALALPAAAIGVYALLRGGISGLGTTLWTMKPWWGMALIVALNLPWTLALWARDPRLVEFFYLRINLDAFLHGNYNHPGPWWYYGPILAGSLAPFTVVALPLLMQALGQCLRTLRLQRDGWQMSNTTDPTRLFLVSVVLGTMLFLSLSSAKLGSYLMPTMPAVMVLLADLMNGWKKVPRWVTVMVIAQAAILLLAVLLAPLVVLAIHESLEAGKPLVLAGLTFAEEPGLREIDWAFTPLLLAALAAVGLAALASVVAVMSGRVRLALGALACGTTCVAVLILPNYHRLLPNRDATPLVTTMEALMQRERNTQANEPLTTADASEVILLHESSIHDYELQLALRRPVSIWRNARETGLGFFAQATPAATPLPGPGQPIDHPYHVNGGNTTHPRLWSDARLVAAWNGPQRVWLFAGASVMDELQALGLKPYLIAKARRKALISNRP